jgi:hypothetical protein
LRSTIITQLFGLVNTFFEKSFKKSQFFYFFENKGATLGKKEAFNARLRLFIVFLISFEQTKRGAGFGVRTII